MKKFLSVIFVSLLLSGNANANSNEIILYCVDKIHTGSEGKLYDKEVSYKRENFILKLDLIKKNVKIDNHHYFEDNFLYKTNKTMVTSWHVIINPTRVKLYCPTCWDRAKGLIDSLVKDGTETNANDSD